MELTLESSVSAVSLRLEFLAGCWLVHPLFLVTWTSPLGIFMKWVFSVLRWPKNNQDFTLLVLVETINWFFKKMSNPYYISGAHLIWSWCIFLCIPVLFVLISSREFCIVNWKNTQNRKIKSYVLFIGNFYNLSLGGSISSEPERTALRRQKVI